MLLALILGRQERKARCCSVCLFMATSETLASLVNHFWPNANGDCNGLRERRIKVTESSCAGDSSCMVWSRCKVGTEREKDKLF